MWSQSKLAADLKLKPKGIKNRVVKLPVLTKWLYVSSAVWPEKKYFYSFLKWIQMFWHIYINRFLKTLIFCSVNHRISATKHVHFMYFMCRYWFRLKGWGVGLSLYTVTCPLITDYHRLFVLWPVAVYKISHRSWRMPGNSLSGIQHGTGIFWQVKLYQHKHAQNENKHNPDC